MITIKKPEEIKILREGGKILALVLHQVAERIKPGLAAIELDELAEKLIRERGGEPSFKNYKTTDDRIPFPASLCVSINDEVVHGIPSREKILREGDIVSLDLGMKYKNLYTDAAITVGVGHISAKAEKIIETAKKSLDEGVGATRDGAYIGDISFAIQNYAEQNGFRVIRKLVGHGVGYKAHEEPEIPNFGQPKNGEQLKAGMILALEPMITLGNPDIYLDKDEWTWKTKNGSLAAHFEHTVAVNKFGAEVLTKILRID